MRTTSLALAALLVLPSLSHADAPPRERLNVVRIGEIPVGTASEKWTDEDGKRVYRVHMNTHFSRMGTPLSMSLFTEEVSGPDGKFQRARMTSSLSNLDASATLEGDSVRYESKAGGVVRRVMSAWNPEAVTEAQAQARIEEWLAGRDPELSITMFDVSDGAFHVQKLVRGETVQETIAGEARELVVADAYEDGATTPTSTAWYGIDGSALRTLIRQLGVEIVIERATVEQLASLEITTSFDIIRQSMVRCPDFPVPTSGVKAVTLRLTFAERLPKANMNGPNQREVSRDKKSILLELTRESSNHDKLDDATRVTFLKPDRFIQSDNAVLKGVADSLRTASNTDGWELAKVITRFVNKHITRKGMEHGYDSALDVYRSRAGDCTEHSLLTVALLRAAGIPARPVVGLAYGASEGAFVGHMWVESCVDEWRTLDALDLNLDPIRIRVHAPVASEAMGERDLMRAYGEVAGVTIRVADSR